MLGRCSSILPTFHKTLRDNGLPPRFVDPASLPITMSSRTAPVTNPHGSRTKYPSQTLTIPSSSHTIPVTVNYTIHPPDSKTQSTSIRLSDKFLVLDSVMEKILEKVRLPQGWVPTYSGWTLWVDLGSWAGQVRNRELRGIETRRVRRVFLKAKMGEVIRGGEQGRS